MKNTIEAGMVVDGLFKRYGSNDVLQGIDLVFERGSVHALLGPNGAGKSTLLGCLSGAVTPDSGHIDISGNIYDAFTPTTAFDAGIAIIYQHFQLIPSLSVSDNVFLGDEIKSKLGFVQFAQQSRATRDLLSSIDVDIDPNALVESLSIGQQQVVEIARALRRKPSILILDEPTAALSDHEISSLLQLVRRLALDHNLTVIYVTHLLREVLIVADTATIIRDGKVAWTRPVVDLVLDDLVSGISPGTQSYEQRGRQKTSPLLTLSEFAASKADPIDLVVEEGEILGVFGLLGSGRTNLVESLVGVRPHSGAVALLERKLGYSTPRGAADAGLVFVPSDRKEQSLFGDMSAQENLLLPNIGRLKGRFGVRSKSRERAEFDVAAERLQLHPLDPSLSADSFSGGNAQKLVVGRWITGLGETKVIVLDEPTQGVDIGSRREIYSLLHAYVDQPQKAVVFTSSDPDEVVALADRVLVLASGVAPRIVDPAVGVERLISLAHGSDE